MSLKSAFKTFQSLLGICVIQNGFTLESWVLKLHKIPSVACFTIRLRFCHGTETLASFKLRFLLLTCLNHLPILYLGGKCRFWQQDSLFHDYALEWATGNIPKSFWSLTPSTCSGRCSWNKWPWVEMNLLQKQQFAGIKSFNIKFKAVLALFFFSLALFWI